MLPELARVRAYYDETWLDYRLLWLNRQNRAIHFGYWDAHTRSHSESLTNMNRALADRIGISIGARILDAGCGVGGSAIWLAKTYDAKVVGITPVSSQIARARRYAHEQGVADRVSFEEQDYTCTTFPDATFDVVWAIESVCHAREKARFLAQAHRLLQPGGRLGIVEYMRFRPGYPASDEQLLNSWLSGWAIPGLATGNDLMQWTRREGFHDVQLVDITPYVRPSLRRLHRMALIAWPFAVVLRGLGLRSEAQHGNIRGGRDQYRALKRGLWFEAILTATAGAAPRSERTD